MADGTSGAAKAPPGSNAGIVSPDGIRKGKFGMSLFTHLAMLEDKHLKLEGLLTKEAQRPSPDFSVVQTLKKQKLLIKEEMERIRRLQGVRQGDVA
ncbi:MAG: YdcH family protein [Alphaproteobacteria bacterium]